MREICFYAGLAILVIPTTIALTVLMVSSVLRILPGRGTDWQKRCDELCAYIRLRDAKDKLCAYIRFNQTGAWPEKPAGPELELDPLPLFDLETKDGQR